MLATALIVALAAAQAAPVATPDLAAPAATAPALQEAAPLPAVATQVAAPEAAEVRRPVSGVPQKRLRWGLGAATMPGQSGAGGSMEVGFDLSWWGALGLRGTLGLELAQLWGSFWIAPEVAWRITDREEGFGPYLAGGVMVAAISVADPNRPMSNGALGWRSDAAGGATGNDNGITGAGISLNPFQAAIGPTASAGFALRLGRTVAMDLGARYGLLYTGNVEHQISFTLAVNGQI